MKISPSETAVSFETKELCQQWIKDRIVRFQILMHHAPTSRGVIPIPQKANGKIVNTTAADFKKTSLDEPLSKYARPVRDGAVWRAVIKSK